MLKFKKFFDIKVVGITTAVMLIFIGVLGVSCDEITSSTFKDSRNTRTVANKLHGNQPSPTDIDYSLERFNLIRRAYWVNGQREKARMLPSPIADMPLGYIILFTNSGAILNKFVVEGKVTSLQSFLNPESEKYAAGYTIDWLPDVDGAYGSNDKEAIFFFTTDGKYIEYRGNYLYSDIPFEVEHPILKIGGGK